MWKVAQRNSSCVAGAACISDKFQAINSLSAINANSSRNKNEQNLGLPPGWICCSQPGLNVVTSHSQNH